MKRRKHPRLLCKEIGRDVEVAGTHGLFNPAPSSSTMATESPRPTKRLRVDSEEPRPQERSYSTTPLRDIPNDDDEEVAAVVEEVRASDLYMCDDRDREPPTPGMRMNDVSCLWRRARGFSSLRLGYGGWDGETAMSSERRREAHHLNHCSLLRAILGPPNAHCVCMHCDNCLAHVFPLSIVRREDKGSTCDI